MSSTSASVIKGEQIQRVVVLDHKSRWDKWTDAVSKKGQQRLYYLRKMESFSVSPPLLKVLYNSFIESVLTFCIICWFRNVTVEQKSLFRKVLSTASKLLVSLWWVYNKFIRLDVLVELWKLYLIIDTHCITSLSFCLQVEDLGYWCFLKNRGKNLLYHRQWHF